MLNKITENELNNLRIESDAEKAYEKALSLVERQKYTISRLKSKLLSKGFDEDVVNNVIKRLKEYGFVSDEDFAGSFIRSSTTKSKRELEQALYAKGIAGSVIEKALEEENIDDEKTAAILAEKFMRYKEPSKENINKLLAYLYRKGFSFSLAQNVAKKFGFCEVDDV